MRIISVLLLLLSTAALEAQNLFPLQTGNQWTYRERNGDVFTMSVGDQVVVNDQSYYTLTGYGTEPLLVRFVDASELVVYSREQGKEFLLTTFEPLRGVGWFSAPFRECELEGQGQNERKAFQGPAGTFEQALTIVYRTFTCADAGITSEVFAPSFGMVQRTFNTFVGPRVYDLISARVGNITVQVDRGAFLRIAFNDPPYGSKGTANVGLVVFGDRPVSLHYLNSQEIDAVVRSMDGKVMWHLNEGNISTEAIRNEDTFGRSWQVTIPMTDQAGNPLPQGTYQLEAWLPTGFDRPQFAASMNLKVTYPTPQTENRAN